MVPNQDSADGQVTTNGSQQTIVVERPASTVSDNSQKVKVDRHAVRGLARFDFNGTSSYSDEQWLYYLTTGNQNYDNNADKITDKPIIYNSDGNKPNAEQGFSDILVPEHEGYKPVITPYDGGQSYHGRFDSLNPEDPKAPKTPAAQLIQKNGQYYLHFPKIIIDPNSQVENYYYYNIEYKKATYEVKYQYKDETSGEVVSPTYSVQTESSSNGQYMLNNDTFNHDVDSNMPADYIYVSGKLAENGQTIIPSDDHQLRTILVRHRSYDQQATETRTINYLDADTGKPISINGQTKTEQKATVKWTVTPTNKQALDSNGKPLTTTNEQGQVVPVYENHYSMVPDSDTMPAVYLPTLDGYELTYDPNDPYGNDANTKKQMQQDEQGRWYIPAAKYTIDKDGHIHFAGADNINVYYQKIYKVHVQYKLSGTDQIINNKDQQPTFDEDAVLDDDGSQYLDIDDLNERIDAQLPENYEYVSGKLDEDAPNVISVDPDDEDATYQDGDTITVYLKRATIERPGKTVEVKRTIEYLYNDPSSKADQPIRESKSDSVILHSTEVVDKVTRKVIGIKWEKGEFPAIVSPDIPGYTINPLKKVMKSKAFHYASPIVDRVYYTPNKQTATLKFVDDTTDQPLDQTESVTGFSDEGPVSFENGAQDVQNFLNQGYEFVGITNDTTNATLDGQDYDHAAQHFGNFDHDDAHDQFFTVHLKRNVQPTPTPTPQPVADTNVTYIFHDDTDNKNVGTPVVVSGQPGSTKATGLTLPAGYKLAEHQSLPATVQLSTSDQTITIHLVHSTKTVTPGDNGVTQDQPAYQDLFKTVTRTINVVNPLTGETEPHLQSVVFGRTGVYDQVTKAFTSFGNWQVFADGALTNEAEGAWAEFDAPEFAGYTPSQAVVNAQTVNTDTKDATITITYTQLTNDHTTTGEDHDVVVNDHDDHQTAQQTVSNKKVQTTSQQSSEATKQVAQQLPQTGNKTNSAAVAGLGLAGLGILFGFGRKKREY